jgi:hypothetical protein
LGYARALAEAGEDGREGSVATEADVSLDKLYAGAVDAGEALSGPDLLLMRDPLCATEPHAWRVLKPALGPGAAAEHSLAAVVI